MAETIELTPAQVKAVEVLEASYDAFNQGEITKSADLLGTVIAKDIPPHKHGRYYFLVLGCANYRRGSQSHAKQLNQQLPTTFFPALRYRLALRQNDIATAKMIRRTPDLPATDVRDFAWSASLACLWSGKIKTGLRLYTNRMGARNFGNFIPKGVIYQEFRADGDELDHVFLEQGVGDVLIHLLLMRCLASHKSYTFVGEGRYIPFIERYFPGSKFLLSSREHAELEGRKMHASGDYVAAYFATYGTLKPKKLFDKPYKNGAPVFGVCWRGGSAQNRREERRYPLHFFLDMLPQGANYVALQADISPEEEAYLRKDGRVQIPQLDIRRNMIGLYDMVRGMAGVIAVDSANWHLAGLSDVPIYALMNETKHWYWLKDGKVENTYRQAVTVPKNAIDSGHLADWIKAKSRKYEKRQSAPALLKGKAAKPVFITGIPRSGTSMTAGVFARSGLWVGETIKGNAANPKGFFENKELREKVVKPSLIAAGVDPLGVTSLAPLSHIPPYPELGTHALNILKSQGYDEAMRWGYKEPKLTLVWPQWAKAFPDAHWVIVSRDPEGVVRSCLKTAFMRRHSADSEYWRVFINTYENRLSALKDTAKHVHVVSSDQLAAGDTDQVRKVIKKIGLSWDEDSVRDFVDGSLFNRA